jgi:hypothetical protein
VVAGGGQGAGDGFRHRQQVLPVSRIDSGNEKAANTGLSCLSRFLQRVHAGRQAVEMHMGVEQIRDALHGGYASTGGWQGEFVFVCREEPGWLPLWFADEN